MNQETHKSTLRCFLIVANTVLGSFFFGYAIAYMNVSLKTINYVFGIPDDQKDLIDGLISALTPIGAAVGAVASGPLLQMLSRKQSLIFTDVVSMVGLGVSLIANLYSLYIARFIIGVAVGLNSSLVPLYIKEYTPLSLSGSMGSMNQFTINFGVLIAFVMGLGYNSTPEDNNDLYWRIVFGLPIATNLLRIFIFLTIFKDDPPGYYVFKGDQDKAIEVLKKIYKKAYVNEVLTEIERDERQKQQQASRYKDLVSLLYKRRFIVGILLSLLQQFSGINAVIFYSTNIFNQITSDPATVSLLNILVAIVNLVFSGFVGILMKKLGRKTLLVGGDAACMVSLFALAFFSYEFTKSDSYKYLVIGFLFAFLIAFQLSLGPITWIYLAEILPEKGVSIAVLFNWIATSIVAQVFPKMNSAINIYGCFAVFGGFCFLGLFFLIFMLQETKGKTAKDIDYMYSLLSPESDLNHSLQEEPNKIQ